MGGLGIFNTITGANNYYAFGGNSAFSTTPTTPPSTTSGTGGGGIGSYWPGVRGADGGSGIVVFKWT
jgi:hypothetical protein